MKFKNIINLFEIEMKPDPCEVPHYAYNISAVNSLDDMESSLLYFDVKELPPGALSCPYHYHSDEEEVFVIIEGEATLRQNGEKKIVKKGDLLFFKSGPEGAHQLYNHSDAPVKYLDLSTNRDTGFVGYPDSKKVNIGNGHIYKEDDRVSYFEGEQEIPDFWKK